MMSLILFVYCSVVLLIIGTQGPFQIIYEYQVQFQNKEDL